MQRAKSVAEQSVAEQNVAAATANGGAFVDQGGSSFAPNKVLGFVPRPAAAVPFHFMGLPGESQPDPWSEYQ